MDYENTSNNTDYEDVADDEEDQNAKVGVASTSTATPHSAGRDTRNYPLYGDPGPSALYAGMPSSSPYPSGRDPNSPPNAPYYPSPTVPPLSREPKDVPKNKRFDILPGRSEKNKQLQKELTEKSYDYDDMFYTETAPLPGQMNTCFQHYYSIVAQVIYYLLTVLLTPIILLLLGIVSGVFSFTYAWVMSPCYNYCDVIIPRLSRPLKLVLKHCLAPCYAAAAELLSGIRVKYSKVPVHDSSTSNIA